MSLFARQMPKSTLKHARCPCRLLAYLPWLAFVHNQFTLLFYLLAFSTRVYSLSHKNGHQAMITPVPDAETIVLHRKQSEHARSLVHLVCAGLLSASVAFPPFSWLLSTSVCFEKSHWKSYVWHESSHQTHLLNPILPFSYTATAIFHHNSEWKCALLRAWVAEGLDPCSRGYLYPWACHTTSVYCFNHFLALIQ